MSDAEWFPDDREDFMQDLQVPSRNFQSGDGVPEFPRRIVVIPFRTPRLARHRSLMSPIERVLFDVAYERVQQDRKWGPNRNLSNDRWAVILGEEFGEACEATLELPHYVGDVRRAEGVAKLRNEAIQAAAVAVAWVEAMDRQEAKSKEKE